MNFLKQGVSATIMFGPFVDETDGVTLRTDATTISDIDNVTTGIFLSKNGGTAAIRNGTPTASVADVYGMMKVTLNTTDINTVGQLDVLYAKAASYLPVHKSFMVIPAQVYDSLVAGTELLGINAEDLGGQHVNAVAAITFPATVASPTNITGGTITTVTNLTNLPAAAATAVELSKVPKSDSNVTFNATALASLRSEVQGAIETNHLDHLLAVDYDPASKPGVATALLNELIANDAGVSQFSINALETAPSGTGASAAAIADAVWDEARSGHTTTGTYGEVAELPDVADAVWDEALSGHVTTGTSGKALGDASAAGDPWNISLPGSYGAGKAGKIVGDNLNAPVATVDTIADSILAAVNNIHDTDLPAVKSDTAAILVDTGTTLDARIPAALVSGRMDSSVGAMATDTLSTDAFSAGAVDKILDDVVEGSYTLRQLFRGIMASLGGKLSGAASTTITIRDTGDTKNRIVATVDADGNRTAVTLDLT